MIKLWIKKIAYSKKPITSTVLAMVILWTSFSSSFAEISFWNERSQTLREKKNKQETIQRGLNALTARDLNADEKRFPFKIPSNFGTVVEDWDGGLKEVGEKHPHIILIQDIHETYGAQKNMAGILKLLSDQISTSGKPLLVCSEGAWGRVYPEWLSVFPDEALRNQMAEELLKEGKITGEEYLVMLQGMGKLEIHGAEDEEIYKANLMARAQGLKTRAEILQQLSVLDKRVEKLKEHLFSPALAALDQKTKKYEGQQISLEKYLEYLDLTVPISVRKDHFPHIALFKGLLRQEQTLHGNKIADEGKKLLKTETTKDLAVAPNRNGEEFQSKKVIEMNDSVRLEKIQKQSAAFLSDYAQYLKARTTLKIDDLNQEIGELERAAYKSVARSDEEKRLIGLGRVLKMAGKLWNEKMTPSDWDNYLLYSSMYFPSLQEGYQISAEGLKEIERNLEQQEKRLSLSPLFEEPNQTSSLKTNSFSRLKLLHESFYKLAEKRNAVMADKIINLAREKRDDFAVLIAGGFHTPGITSRFRKAGTPYTVLCPNLALSTPGSENSQLQNSFSQHANENAQLSLIENYILNLKQSKAIGSKDYGKEVDAVINILKNKLHMAGPVSVGDKFYVFGMFREENKWSHYAFEFQENPVHQKPPSYSLALNPDKSTLRNAMGTILANANVPFPLLQIAGQSMVGKAECTGYLDETRIKTDLINRRFRASRSMLASLRIFFGDFLNVVDIEPQGNVMAFSLSSGMKASPPADLSSRRAQNQLAPTPKELSQQHAKPDVVIIGAGIAGLVAAYKLKKRGVRVTVLESGPRVGGRMKTENLGGVETDLGAQFLSTSYSTLIPLIKELGLEKNLVPVAPWTGFIQNGKVNRIRSDNLFTLLTSGAMHWKEWFSFIWSGLKLVWSIRGFKTGDYSSWHQFDNQDAANWIESHFGKRARDYVFEPFFQGLYFQPLEGMSKAFVLAIIALGISKPKTLILKGGMESLTNALEAELRPNIKLNTAVKRLNAADKTVVIQTDQETIEADRVILATPASIAKDLFVQADDIEQKLMSTGYSSSILISIVINDKNWRDQTFLKGVYGLLIPSNERGSIASVAIESSKHRDWKGQGEILNVMLSGEKSLEMLGRPDDEILAAVLPELERYFPNLSDSSYATHIRRWKEAMPTSPVGRSKLLEQYRSNKGTRRIILAGDYMGMPYTDSAAETGTWSSSQIPSSVLDPVFRAIIRVLQRRGWRRGADFLDGFRKIYNVLLAPVIETYLFLNLPAAHGLIPLVAIGFFSFLLFDAATEIIFDPHLRGELGSRSLKRALWALAFIAPFLPPLVGSQIFSPGIQFSIAAGLHMLRNLTQNFPQLGRPRTFSPIESGDDIQKKIDHALLKDAPATSEERGISALANSIGEEWKEKKQAPFILLDLDGLVVANKNGISIDSWVAQCVRKINEQIQKNGMATQNVAVILNPKSMDHWASRWEEISKTVAIKLGIQNIRFSFKSSQDAVRFVLSEKDRESVLVVTGKSQGDVWAEQLKGAMILELGNGIKIKGPMADYIFQKMAQMGLQPEEINLLFARPVALQTSIQEKLKSEILVDFQA